MPNWLHLFLKIGYLERALEARRVHLTPDMPDSDPQRRAFNTLHKRAEGADESVPRRGHGGHAPKLESARP